MKTEISWVDILVVASTALLIYFLLTRIFGHSATDITLIVTTIITVAGWMFKLEHRYSSLNREVGEFKAEFKEFKNQVGKEFSELKQIIRGK